MVEQTVKYTDTESGEGLSIPREQFETVLLRAQIELLQRVERLVTLLEQRYDLS
jgi:hypothetical protein